MSDTSRRKLLKSIAAGSGAIVAGKSLPDSWSRPVVDSVLLPVHAQTSPTSPIIYAIGDTGPGGGIVFYITNGGLNGLEAAPSDQDGGSGVSWGCISTQIGTTGTAIGTGATNTTDILGNTCSAAGIAADIASTYAGGGFSDWFLPSRDELNELFGQRVVVGSFDPNGAYWSSSETSASGASLQVFNNSGLQIASNKSGLVRVRPVRGF